MGALSHVAIGVSDLERPEDGPHASFKDRRDARNTRIREATLAAVCELALVMTLASMSTLSILRV